jgi:hypothetical protein
LPFPAGRVNACARSVGATGFAERITFAYEIGSSLKNEQSFTDLFINPHPRISSQ